MPANIVRQGARDADAPIFVVGVGRSGTTLLAAILDAHPRLSCGPETNVLCSWPENDARRILSPSAWPNRAVDYLYAVEQFGRPIPENYGVPRAAVESYLATQRPSLRAIVSALPELFMAENGKTRWVEKTPNHLLHVERIRQLFPTARIIRIVRDPRDVALSLEEMPWFPGTFIDGIQLWRRNDARSRRFFETDEASYTLRYEDLVSDTEREMRSLCLFLGEDFEPQMLLRERSTRNVNRIGEPWKLKAAQPIDPSHVERWRGRLRPEQNAIAEAVVGDRMMALNYRIERRPGRLYAIVHPWGAIDDSLATEIVAHRIRFWPQQPREKPRLMLFVGVPGKDNWLPAGRLAQAKAAFHLCARVCTCRLLGCKIVWWANEADAGSRGIRQRIARAVLGGGSCSTLPDGLLERLSENDTASP